jgi:hypothetical protein
MPQYLKYAKRKFVEWRKAILLLRLALLQMSFASAGAGV